MKIFNSQTIEMSADDLRIMILKNFMGQFDTSGHNAIEIEFVLDKPKNGGLKAVKIFGKTSMEI